MSSDKQNNKEFGQLGDIAKKLESTQQQQGGNTNDKDLKAQAAEAYGKFEKLWSKVDWANLKVKVVILERSKLL